MKKLLIAAALSAAPFLAPQPAAADTIYPWCLYDSRGATNCGFVSEQQCRWSKTANSDMCGPNGLYFRGPVRNVDRNFFSPPIYSGPKYSGPKRARYYRG